MVFPLYNIVKGARSLVTPFIQPLFVPFLYWLFASLGTIISFWTNGDRIQDENEFANPLNTKPYDFIIVGAGSAGCLLANRLSRHYNVLLFEAGGEPNPLQFIPGFSLLLPNFPEIDWQHKTVSQKFGSLNSVNEQSSWSTGMGLGGSGMLNYMIHLRGHKKDFDNWAEITGDPSWSWEGVLPFFKSYENYEVPGDNVNHGYTGDLRIESPDQPKTAADFVRAGGELGYPNVDLNAPFKEGFDIIRYPIKQGVRQAPYKAFLEPVRYRNTLTIMKFSQVNKILFKGDNVAYGVEYDRHGRTYVAQATREVIISAGAVGTPKLLMLSGIGPKSDLDELNIPVVSDLPVGENLQDHLAAYLGAFYVHPGTGFYTERDLTIGEIIKWFTLGRGVLTNTRCEATGIFSSSYAKERGEGDWPDIQLFQYGITNYKGGISDFSRVYNLKFDEVDKYHRDGLGRDSVFVVVSGARPYSRGYIKLGGSSPYDKPIIDPNYLGDPGEVDLKVLLEAVKRTMILMENTTAGAIDMGVTFTTTKLPGCEHLEFRSDEYWTCYIRRYTVTLHHPVGTAAMGSVVDTQLRVMGVQNLRVIDASIEPVLVVTNTQAGTLMIAEKGADMILKYWNGQTTNQGQRAKPANPYNKPFESIFGGYNNVGFGKINKNFQGNNTPLQKNVTKYSTQSIPPSGVPAKYKIIPGYEVNDEETKRRLLKSFEDLTKMSELVKEQYNSNLKNYNSGYRPVAPKKAGTTTTFPYDSNNGHHFSELSRQNRGNAPVTILKLQEQNIRKDYYDFEDEHAKTQRATTRSPKQRTAFYNQNNNINNDNQYYYSNIGSGGGGSSGIWEYSNLGQPHNIQGDTSNSFNHGNFYSRSNIFNIF